MCLTWAQQDALTFQMFFRTMSEQFQRRISEVGGWEREDKQAVPASSQKKKEILSADEHRDGWSQTLQQRVLDRPAP